MAGLRRLALLAVGLLLVTVPLWAPALDVTGADYEYRAAQVVVEDNRLSVPGDHVGLPGVDGVDCFYEQFPSRRCAFETRLLDGATLRADYPGVRHLSGDPSLDGPERHVAFAGDGRVFERTTGWNDSAGAYVLGLERANASAVVADAARSLNRVDRPVRQTVETGTATADDPLPEPTLVRAESGRYFVVYTASTTTVLSSEPVTEGLLEWVAVFVGLAALHRGWTAPS